MVKFLTRMDVRYGWKMYEYDSMFILLYIWYCTINWYRLPDYEKLSPRLLLLPTVRIGNITQLFTLHYISHQHQDDKEQPLQNLDKNGKDSLINRPMVTCFCDKTKLFSYLVLDDTLFAICTGSWLEGNELSGCCHSVPFFPALRIAHYCHYSMRHSNPPPHIPAAPLQGRGCIFQRY